MLTWKSRTVKNFSMKISCIIVVMVLITSAYGEDPAYQQHLHEVHLKCQKETSADVTLVINALEKGQFVEDSKMKCYFLCVGKEMGHLNPQGSLVDNAFGPNVPFWMNQTNAAEVIKTCSSVKGSDPCDTAFRETKCLKLGPTAT